jgi:hypothetical protein
MAPVIQKNCPKHRLECSVQGCGRNSLPRIMITGQSPPMERYNKKVIINSKKIGLVEADFFAV